MKNRIVATLTLGSFLVFSWSCYSIREIKPDVLASGQASDYEIRKLEMKSGEIIEYDKESPARVQQGQITGTGTMTFIIELVEVDGAGLKILSRPGDPFMSVKTRDGRIYGRIKNIDERGDKSILHIMQPGHGELSSPTVLLSEIGKAWINEFDGLKTTLLITVSITLGSVLAAWISLYIAFSSIGKSNERRNFTTMAQEHYKEP